MFSAACSIAFRLQCSILRKYWHNATCSLRNTNVSEPIVTSLTSSLLIIKIVSGRLLGELLLNRSFSTAAASSRSMKMFSLTTTKSFVHELAIQRFTTEAPITDDSISTLPPYLQLYAAKILKSAQIIQHTPQYIAWVHRRAS